MQELVNGNDTHNVTIIPKFIADVFFENTESSSGYAELRDIIVANSQQLFACEGQGFLKVRIRCL